MSTGSESERSHSRSDRGLGRKSKKDKKDKKGDKDEDKLDRLMAMCGGIQTNVGGLTTQIGTLQTSMGSLQSTLETFKGETNEKFKNLSGKYDTLEQKVDQQAEELKQLKQERQKDVEMGGTRVDFVENPYSAKGKGKDKTPYIHPSKRRAIVIRGFKRDSIQDVVEEATKEMTKEFGGIVSIKAPGKLCSYCKVIFADSDAMWELLKGMKGKKFKYDGQNLIHEIEKTEEERTISIRTSIAVNELRKYAIEKQLCTEETKKTFIDGDWNVGYAYVIKAGAAIRLVERNRKTQQWGITSEAANAIEGFNFDDLVEKLNEPK